MANLAIGTILCQLRKRNSLTQRELAKRLGVHITTIKNRKGDNCYPDAKIYVPLQICSM